MPSVSVWRHCKTLVHGCATPAASPGSLLLSLGVELKMIDYFVEVNVPMSDSMSSRM